MIKSARSTIKMAISSLASRPAAQWPNFREILARTDIALPVLIFRLSNRSGRTGSRLGTIFLQADLGEMYSRFTVYGLLLLLSVLRPR